MKREILPVLNAEDKTLMENMPAAGKIKHKFAARLLTVLHRAKGKGTNEIAAIVGIHPMTLSLYAKRCNTGGIQPLVSGKTRKPGKTPIPEALKNKICGTACAEKPADAAHWSVRSLAKRFGIGRGAVNRILRERDIKPHLVKKFSLSNDPGFAEKLTDAVGLYMNPPDNEIILCADEKSRIQALERTAPLLPMLPHVPERQTVAYERHGTTALFWALDMLTGNVTGECEGRHTAKEYTGFLKNQTGTVRKGKRCISLLIIIPPAKRKK
jgi:transposase